MTGAVVQWGAAGLALGDPGEGGESGDLHVVVEAGPRALVAVIDGLGHGREAAAAARAGAAIIEAHSSEPLPALVQRCHQGLRGTRGAVMSLAVFDAGSSSLAWIGVGNVEGILVRAEPGASAPREAILVRGGVVGYQLPPLRATARTVSPGDTLILATDGIRSGFADRPPLERGPQAIADWILASYRKGSDDALALVARYQGGRR